MQSIQDILGIEYLRQPFPQKNLKEYCIFCMIKGKQSEQAANDDNEKRKSSPTNQKPVSENSKSATNAFKCNVCQAGFPTRNKLFQHIKERGHALKVDAKHEGDKPQKQEKKKGKKKR